MKLEATKREPGKANELRTAGRIPAVIYNKELNESISVDLRAFDRAFRAQGTSSLIDLDVNGEVHAVLVKQVQMNKRRREPMHVDFYAITANQPVEVAVPIEITGVAAGVKDHAGMMDVQRREVRISILPRLIPSHIELDVSELQIGDSLHVQNLVASLPSEATVLDDLELAIVAIVPPRLAEEEEDEGEAVTEPELVGDSEEEAEAEE
jgi:large subunit ribosomal protein L25